MSSCKQCWNWSWAPCKRNQGDYGDSLRERQCNCPSHRASCRGNSAIPPAARGPLAPSFMSGAWHGTVGYFSSGWPVAYLVATVIFGIGLLIGSLCLCPSPYRLPGNRQCPAGRLARAKMDRRPDHRHGRLPVGRGSGIRSPGSETSAIIQSLIPNPQSLVSLGDRFALASGLMEITYDTGAKVICRAR